MSSCVPREGYPRAPSNTLRDCEASAVLSVVAAETFALSYAWGVAERRRLPLIQSAPPPPPTPNEDGEAKRPPWHWVGFGTVAIFAVWLPLAYGAQAMVSRMLIQRFGSA